MNIDVVADALDVLSSDSESADDLDHLSDLSDAGNDRQAQDCLRAEADAPRPLNQAQASAASSSASALPHVRTMPWGKARKMQHDRSIVRSRR